jgi:formamidopyrimidine-DNA glycosylase
MLEIPESYTIVKQLNETVKGKIISYVKANQSPHSFTGYFNNPEGYDDLLSGKIIGNSIPRAGMVEIEVEDCRLLFGDGATIRYYDDLSKLPKKHQLLVEFDDQTALVCTIQMYGSIWAYREGENENPYYIGSKEKPSPLSDDFNYDYFLSLRTEKANKLSAKAFLATEQRIPGLGNGVLQDILFIAGIHPKRKLTTVSDDEYRNLYNVIKNTLKEMAELGGRDTEKDLFGNEGGYKTLLSKKTLFTPCTKCGYELHKESYLGGTIYYCEHCQN